MTKKLEDYILEAEAIKLTGYGQKQLYRYRKGLNGFSIRWIAAKSGKKIRYHKGDLLKLIGL